MTKQITRLLAIHGLTLLGIATAWAGRGDIDPKYGEGGRLSVMPGALLALPDDRLVVSEATGEGFRVRIVDAAGNDDPSFGDGGDVLLDSPAAARTFQPESATRAPDGDLIFVGSLSDTGARVLLRLDHDGQPVLSFGDRGDGFFEPPFHRAITFDSDGKIFLAAESQNPDIGCRNTVLRRLLADGQPDEAFGGDGTITVQNLDICSGVDFPGVGMWHGTEPVFGARSDDGVIVGNGHTFVAVNAAGDIDPTFGVNGRLTVDEIAWSKGLLLPDGGLLVFGLRGVSPSANDTVFLKFDRNGQPDLDFGQGTGSVNIDLSTELLADAAGYEYVYQLALDPDGEHVVAHFGLRSAVDHYGIARLTIGGTPDTGFGSNGFTRLNFDLVLMAVQSDGAPLFKLPGSDLNDDVVFRLLPDNSPSPGFLRVLTRTVDVRESEGTATVAIERFAGRDGAVSLDYTTADRSPGGWPGHCSGCGRRWSSATAGSDYTQASGRLDWASGDDDQRTVIVSIVNDTITEGWEIFGVDFSEPNGVVHLFAAGTSVFISDHLALPTPPPTDPTDSTDTGGGGGSMSWATQLALLTLLFIRRRRIRRADQLRH